MAYRREIIFMPAAKYQSGPFRGRHEPRPMDSSDRSYGRTIRARRMLHARRAVLFPGVLPE